MEEPKWQKTKFALGALGVTAAAVVGVPVVLGMYVYGKTAELAVHTINKAFQHPVITAGALTGALLYNAHHESLHDRVQAFSENTYNAHIEQQLDTLQQKNRSLEQQLATYKQGVTPSQTNKSYSIDDEVLVGLGIGAGGATVGLLGYAYMRRPRSNIRVVSR